MASMGQPIVKPALTPGRQAPGGPRSAAAQRRSLHLRVIDAGFDAPPGRGGAGMPVIGLLGRFFLRTDGRDAGRLAKKGQALIAYLALNRGASAGRERLADLLWPEQDSDHARHSLRNCLLQLRNALPDTERWLIADGDGLRLEPGATEVDADRFLELGRSDGLADLAQAAQLYRGALLTDLAVNSEPFESWVGPERARLQAAACQLHERLAAAQEAAGQTEAALATARRLVALERFSEEGHRRLMRLYAQSGRRAAAISQYRTFVALLREELGVGPDAETEALAKRIQSHGDDRVPSRPVPAVSAPAPAGPLPPATRPAPIVAPAEREEAPRWPVLPRLAVSIAIPRNLTGERWGETLGEALSEDLAIDLAMMGRSFTVIRSNPAAGATIVDPARSGLDYVLSGSVQEWNGLARVNAYLINSASGQYVWARRYHCRPDEGQNLREEIVKGIAQELHMARFRIAGGRGLADAAGIGPMDLIERGTLALREQNTAHMLCKAQESFLHALALSPESTDALVGLARTYQRLMSQPWWNGSLARNEPYDLGREAALAALRFDPDNMLANHADGMLLSGGGEVEKAASAFDRVLAIDPRQPAALAFGGYNAAFLGRASETLGRIELALRVDREMPDHSRSISYFFAGMSQVLLGRTEAAVGYLDKSLALNPSYGSPQLWLAAAHVLRGKDHGGRQVLDAFRDRFPRYRLTNFAQQWITRSNNPVYRRQVDSVFASLRRAGLPD